MGRGLLRWWHRDDVPAGRHVRVLPSASVPGAASTIVAAASLDPRVTGAAYLVPVLPATPVAPGVGAPEPLATTGNPVLPAPGPDGRHDGVAGEGSLPDPVDVAASGTPTGAVGLVFTNGQSLELDGADPRTTAFRDAAAAMLDQP